MVRAILAGRKTVTRRVVAPANSSIDGWPVDRTHWPSLQFDSAWVDPGPSPAGNAGPYLKAKCQAEGHGLDTANYPDDALVHRVYPKWFEGCRLWVREAWSLVGRVASTYEVAYRAEAIGSGVGINVGETRAVDVGFEGPTPALDAIIHELPGRWRPSIHMPRWASRLTLEIADVRVERLQGITEADILAEGVTCDATAAMTGIPWGDLPTLHHAWKEGWDFINGDRQGCRWDDNPWVWVVQFRRVT